jgi:hypothetical protein
VGLRGGIADSAARLVSDWSSLLRRSRGRRVIQSHEDEPEEIVLDLDATDDPLYGHREAQLRAKQKIATKDAERHIQCIGRMSFSVSDPNTRAPG